MQPFLEWQQNEGRNSKSFEVNPHGCFAILDPKSHVSLHWAQKTYDPFMDLNRCGLDFVGTSLQI